MILPDRPTNGVAEVVFLVRLHAGVEVILRIENIISDKLIDVAVEPVGAGLSFHLHGSRTTPAVLSAKI